MAGGAAGVWRRCSACKRDIALAAAYWVCSVSTCNRARTALAFCSVDCWEIHLPTERHREAWAVEKRAPKVAEAPAAAPVVPARAAAPVEALRAENGNYRILSPDQAVEEIRKNGTLMLQPLCGGRPVDSAWAPLASLARDVLPRVKA